MPSTPRRTSPIVSSSSRAGMTMLKGINALLIMTLFLYLYIIHLGDGCISFIGHKSIFTTMALKAMHYLTRCCGDDHRQDGIKWFTIPCYRSEDSVVQHK